MSPMVQNTVSVPANGVINNVLSGSQYEYLPFPCRVMIALNQQSGAVGAILATIYSGTDLLSEEGVISANARVPLFPDDYSWRDEAAAGDRLTIKLRNTTGGIIIVAFGVSIEPL